MHGSQEAFSRTVYKKEQEPAGSVVVYVVSKIARMRFYVGGWGGACFSYLTLRILEVSQHRGRVKIKCFRRFVVLGDPVVVHAQGKGAASACVRMLSAQSPRGDNILFV